MKKFHRYELDGEILEIPLRWDEGTQTYVEDYGSYYDGSAYTPAGRPILLTIEDACRYSEPAEDEPRCIDCGSCVYFRQPRGSLLGVCHNEKTRSGAKLIQVKTNEKEETR